MRSLSQRVLVTAGVVVALLGLAGCASEKPVKVGEVSEDSAEATAAGEGKAAQADFKRDDVVRIGDMNLSVVDAGELEPSTYEKPPKGKTFYKVTVALENVGKGQLDYFPEMFKVEDPSGNQVDYSSGRVGTDDIWDSGSLAPGGKTNGEMSFAVPADMKGLTLVFTPMLTGGEQARIRLTE